MTDRKTSSILQRVPVILAVTAASYGLQLPPTLARPLGAGKTAGVSTTQPQSLALAAPRQGRRSA